MRRKVEEEKANKKKKVSKALVIVILCIAILLCSLAVVYFLMQSNVNKAIANSSEYNAKIAYLVLNKSNVNLVRNEEKSFKVKYGQATVTFSKDNIRRFLDLNYNIEKKTFNNIEDIKMVEVGYLKRNDFESISFLMPDFLKDKKSLKLIAIENENNLKDISEKLKIEENVITISKSEYATNGYIIGYFTPKKIEFLDASEDGTIYLSKGSEKELNLKISPSFSDSSISKIESENTEVLEVIENKKIKAKEKGDITLTCISGELKESVKVHISNYVKEIKVSTESITLLNGKSYTIGTDIVPSDAENPELLFETEQKEVIDIDGNKITAKSIGEADVFVKTKSGENVSKKVHVIVSDKKIEDIDGITYVNGILIANKTYWLPSSYNPGGLTKETMDAFNNMKAAAAKEGLSFWISSGFRSYETQQRLYSNYVANYGKASADTFSARAGHSEHQTGLAMDVNYIEDWFGDTKEGKWLAENAHKFGFIIRYPKSKEEITGYKYEPWHIRYLGVDIATAVYQSGLCLEEYLGITSKYANE